MGTSDYTSSLGSDMCQYDNSYYSEDDDVKVTIKDMTVGGCLHLENTYNVGTAMSVYSNNSGANDPLANFVADSATFGVEVIRIQQDDVSEGCINFVASDRGVVNTSGGNSAASVRVELSGTKYIIPLFTDA